ncbi:DNA-binding protein [Pedobacter chinensis]|uniref:DNA-binding protein n=1 Tax=Pedobacter chinensis TaxID=2282421 RepID=A0A369PVG8_9SPHI|nr:DNA-binding protein [Pedobacter chinensis]RDC56661.1 DNA-binding protein [Pedobacter chinensis]
MKDLTNSLVERKNILNNNLALKEVYTQLGFAGIMFEKRYRYTKVQIANYFGVDLRTIERIQDSHQQELVDSGTEVLTGVRLKQFKEIVSQLTDIDVGQFEQDGNSEIVGTRATSLTVFTFRGFLNMGMLLTGSEAARELRSMLLDIVIDVLNKKLGGTTKYINQREDQYLTSAIREINYRQTFTNAIDEYIDTENKFKYSQLTDKIYLSIFKENAKEYKQVLNLRAKESVRDTMYSEVLDLIASYENGFASYLKRESEKLAKRLRLSEAHQLFKTFEEIMADVYEPLKEKARSLMASRDMAFRDALHEQLKEYVSSVSQEDFERFLGDKSKSLEDRLSENMDVFIRLKDR